MNENLTNQLYEEFPILYRGRLEEMGSCLMCQGFQCQNGWFNLIWQLSSLLTQEMEGLRASDRNPFLVEIKKPSGYLDTMEVLPKVLEVKERHGGLKYILENGSEDMYGLVEMAEQASYYICEVDGEEGKLSVRGNIMKTLCPSCQKRLNFKDMESK